jgi:hypothetical protein
MKASYRSPIGASPPVVDHDEASWAWRQEEMALARREDELRGYLDEQVEVELMRYPLSAETAYRVMGLLLGTLPPAAIFLKLFGYGIFSHSSLVAEMWFLAPLLLAMNIVCAGAGYVMGDVVSRSLISNLWPGRILLSEREPTGHRSWPQFLIRLPFHAAIWGLVTGVAGGILFFFVGAIAGAMYAVPVGVAGFAAFGVLHRLMQRGGMIEARCFLPLALGITAVIAALIMGVPYTGVR